MSAILKMLDQIKNQELYMVDTDSAAIPDIQRLVSWVESAKHQQGCNCNYYGHENKCDCGLLEIQSLIRS